MVILLCQSLLKLISSFDFIVCLVTNRTVFDLTLSVTQLLQSKENDMADGIHLIDYLKTLVTAIRNDIDLYHEKWYSGALLLAKCIDVTDVTKDLSKTTTQV